MAAREVEFWYEFASTYSYPASMRAERLAAQAGVKLVWKPFLLGPIFAAQGWNDSPFNIYPAKGANMWRDLKRICDADGLKLSLPPHSFPQNGLKAARLAISGERAGWTPEFSRLVYRANFAEQKDISDDKVLKEILTALNLDAAATMAAAETPEVKSRLRRQSEEANLRGIFGAPSFMVGDELFWGNDRLVEALAWARRA
jgi:2-hydroxychromene-2-carboxylate isomerase